MQGNHTTAVGCQLEKAAGNCYKGNVVNVEQFTVLDVYVADPGLPLNMPLIL